MKILAFVDLHGSKKALKELEKKAKRADLIVCAGDVSQFENNLKSILAKLNSFGKPILMIHGNHEEAYVLEQTCKKYDNIEFFHKKTKIINEIRFIGFGGGGFDRETPEMAKFFKKSLKKLKNADKSVFITHAPPYKTKLDKMDYNHNGNIHNGNNTIRNMIIKYKLDYTICGHFHENWQKHDKIGKGKVINPGPSGAIFTL